MLIVRLHAKYCRICGAYNAWTMRNKCFFCMISYRFSRSQAPFCVLQRHWNEWYCLHCLNPLPLSLSLSRALFVFSSSPSYLLFVRLLKRMAIRFCEVTQPSRSKGTKTHKKKYFHLLKNRIFSFIPFEWLKDKTKISFSINRCSNGHKLTSKNKLCHSPRHCVCLAFIQVSKCFLFPCRAFHNLRWNEK